VERPLGEALRPIDIDGAPVICGLGAKLNLVH
jgi:hypothetical protein